MNDLNLPLLFNSLLTLHVVAGTATLLSAAVAIVSKLSDSAHKWHVFSGQVFFYAMTGIFVSALGLSLVRMNTPMLFVSIFSFYFAWMGRHYALNRTGATSQLDKAVVAGMGAVFVGMTIYSLTALYSGEGFGLVTGVFGVIGTLNAWGDWQIIRRGGAKGKLRIAEHLGKMLGGTIAALTAFLVINVDEATVLVWLAPTFILTPLIVIWSRKINSGVKRKGMHGD